MLNVCLYTYGQKWAKKFQSFVMSLCNSLVNTLTLCSANQACNSWMLSLISVKVRNVCIKVILHKHHAHTNLIYFHIWKWSRSELRMSDEMSKMLYRLSSKNQICDTFEEGVVGESDLSHIQLWCKCKIVWQIEQTLLLSLFHSCPIKEILSDYIH